VAGIVGCEHDLLLRARVKIGWLVDGQVV
jgi:hypothetical protein